MSEKTTALSPVSGDNAILASRYIDALFDLAEQDGKVDEVIADMKGLRNLWSESPEWRFIASDPRLNHEAVCSVAKQVAEIAGVSKITTNFLMVIAQNRRLNLLPMLIENFMEEVSTRRGEFRADVRTARPLTDAQRQKLANLLAAATGGQIRMEVIEDPSIIGGLTVKIGSQFVDASVKTKLDRLERTLRSSHATA
ncbi:MAG: ATP synthase F1 subunit delta [Bdellovibrionales bacterium]